ncbi:leucine-rich repeat-containing protein 4C-like, partial [Anneissia japonica]|uniref:leucine-rich repeat-containing protein 4C-like n=1 Tax=Anneissia japonica TaxID=1529436 RepID=UPI0014256D28
MVDCSSSSLNTIPSGLPEYTTTLILDGNPLSNVAANSFSDVPNLNRLSMKMCNIQEIEPGAFSSLTNLQTLEIQQNMITNFSNVLSSLTSLKVLKVSQNKLTTLDQSMFMNLRNLLVFEAHNNDISYISPQTFQESPRLTHLYLPNCKLDNLTQSTFKNLINLQYLDVSGNPNNNLGPNIFREMLQLQFLYLSNMAIETLHKDSFSQLTNLRVLSLKNNNLKTVTRETFEDLTNLDYLLLEDNQWNCACPLKDFLTWDRLNTISSDNPWRCYDPEFLRNSIALNVDDRQFGCEPWIYNLELENFGEGKVDIGKSVILTCEAVGDPQPHYEWSAPDGTTITTMNNDAHIYVITNRLIINSVVSKDEGNYMCTATNSKGSDSKDFSLHVTGTITEPPRQQCPLATLNVETVKVSDTAVTVSWTKSFGTDAIGYFVQSNVFGEMESVTTKSINEISTEEATVENLSPGTDYIICVSVQLSGGCPSITTNDQCKQVSTTGLDEYKANLESIENKHTNELIGAAIATFLGTLLILASVFVIIWRYKMPKEYTKYDFKITDETTQFANIGDMPETSSGFQDYRGIEPNVTLVASFNNMGYEGKVENEDQPPLHTKNNDVIQKN